MSVLMLAVGAFLLAFDFQNLLAWWRGRTITPGVERSDDFTIIVPLFGRPDYFEGRGRLIAYCASGSIDSASGSIKS